MPWNMLIWRRTLPFNSPRNVRAMSIAVVWFTRYRLLCTFFWPCALLYVMVLHDCVVTPATRQGSKKPAILDQKKAYNLCEWWMYRRPYCWSVLHLDPTSVSLQLHCSSSTINMEGGTWGQDVLLCGYSACVILMHVLACGESVCRACV